MSPCTFVIGCTHFGHANIIKLAGRPFESVEEMDEEMIARWNRVVKQDDIVYHLGDFAFKNPQKYYEALNGKIRFTRGNHDNAKKWAPYEVMPHYQEITDHEVKVVLCHYPLEEWNGYYKGAMHLHAHTHSSKLRTAPGRFNVCAEAIGYKPVELDSLVSIHQYSGNQMDYV